MGHDISAVVNKKDFSDFNKNIAFLSANANNRAIDYLYLVLDASDCNNQSNGNASMKKFDYYMIERAIQRLQDLDNKFVESDIIPFLQKILDNMNNKVWLLFG